MRPSHKLKLNMKKLEYYEKVEWIMGFLAGPLPLSLSRIIFLQFSKLICIFNGF